MSLKLEKKKDGKVERSGTREAAVAMSTGGLLQWTREQVWLSGAVLTLERLRTAGSALAWSCHQCSLTACPAIKRRAWGHSIAVPGDLLHCGLELLGE